MATNVCLSCDSVFDTLTRGPYPDGESNADVDRHLAACHDCRKMAEALRPATELFHEVMTKELAAGLPVFRGELPEIGVGTIPDSRGAVRGRFWTRMVLCAVCLLMGCAAGFGLRDVSTADESGMASVSMDGSGLLPGQFNLMPTMTVAKLSELPLSEDCHAGMTMANHPTEEQLKSELDCCTRCHKSPQSGGIHADADWTTTIASSCFACHTMPTL